MVFKMYAYGIEFLIYFRHCLLEGFEVGVVRVLCSLVERVRRADTCYDILALGVDEPFSVEPVVTVGRVAGESHSGSGSVAHVSEYHGLYVYGRTPVIRNAFDFPVCDGPFPVP